MRTRLAGVFTGPNREPVQIRPAAIHFLSVGLTRKDGLPLTQRPSNDRQGTLSASRFSSSQFEDEWACFMYEGNSWQYSLSIPHDVVGLITACGGPDAFKSRLDTFFKKHYYYVGNEPCFLCPTLYHWIGLPELSSERIHEIVNRAYNDSREGIPCNDDSGAMSSWLAFHMIGIYPNAGQSYYLVNTPFVPETTLHLEGGKTFKIVANHFSDKNLCIVAARLNGQSLNRTWLEHAEILAGGVRELDLAPAAADWGHGTIPPSMRFIAAQ